MTCKISLNRTHPDSNNPENTIPRTWGVSDVGSKSSRKLFRFGSSPVRGRELRHDYGVAKLIALYTKRAVAKLHADSLN